MSHTNNNTTNNNINIPYLIFLFWILAFQSFINFTSAQTRPNASKSIFILAGQSNMAGRGGVINNIWDRIIPAQSQPSPWILRFNPHFQWEEAHEPLARGIDTNRTVGVGPGMPFAHALLRRGVGPIGLVPWAIGGTNISQWARGGYLYTHLVRRAWASVKQGGTIHALIWFQGESDTVFSQDAELYRRRLERFFIDFRGDLRSPMLPIIQVAIASGEGPYIETVRQAQMAIDLLNLKTVDAKGLPLEPDHLHITTPGQVQLGEHLANAFLQFLPSQQLHSNSNSNSNESNAANILNTRSNSFYTGLALFLLIVFVTLTQRI